MPNCEAYREQMLDLVYDLLDETEAKALHAHLEACASCRDALAAAQGKRAQFALAAMPIGAGAVPFFTRPATAAAPPPAEPATLKFIPPAAPAAATAPRRTARRRYYWMSGAAAAAVMLLAAGFGWHEYQHGHRTRTELIAQQKDVVREIDAQLALLEPTFKRQADDVERKLRAEAPLHLYVLGPSRIAADGGDAIDVAVNDVNGQPVNATVTATLTDPAGREILSRQETKAANGIATVAIGQGLAKALEDRQEVRLNASAAWAGCSASVDETLKVAAPTFVAHLMTNKTIYRPGELLFYRALVLDRANLTPPDRSITLRVTVADAKGNVILTEDAPIGPGGIAAGELAVTPRFADGEYELRVAAIGPGAPDVRPHGRKLQVARDVSYQVQADREQYRPGDIVNLNVMQRQLSQATQAKGNADAANSVGNWSLSLNGKQVPLLQGQPGGAGGGAVRGQNMRVPQNSTMRTPQGANTAGPGGPQTAQVAPGGGVGGYVGPQANFLNNDSAYSMNLQFALPKDLDTTRVRLRIALTEAGRQETVEQELAVVPSRLAVDVYPEGGDLVPGVPNRVYYQVRSLRGEPVNPEGRVIFLSADDVLYDSARGEGAGSFTFTPQVGDTYSVRITGPDGQRAELPDPFARLGGRTGTLVLHMPQAVSAEGDPLPVTLRNPGPPRRVLLVAECRGHAVGQQWVVAQGTETTMAMGPLAGVRGIVKVTVYEENHGSLRPLAERLVYRAPARRLEITALHLGGVISPKLGHRGVQLELRARDEKGEPPPPCWIGGVVVDDRYLGREPSPLAHFFIAGDVRSGEDLDNAAVVAADTPEGRQALDVFLGTAGWRRFEPAGSKLAAARTATDVAFFGRENLSPQALAAQHETKVEEALAPLRLRVQNQRAALMQDKQRASGVVTQAIGELRQFETLPQEYLRLGLGVATLVLFSLACLTLAGAAWRLVRRHSATPLFAGSFACLGLCLIATIMLASLTTTTEAPGGIAQGTLDEMLRLPGWMNLSPRLEVGERLPTGPFALAPAARREREQQANRDPAQRKDAKGVDIAKGAEGDRFGGGPPRALMVPAEAQKKDGAAKAEALRGELSRRYLEKAAQQERAALKQSTPMAKAPLPVPGPPAAMATAEHKKKEALKEAPLDAVRATRQFAYTEGNAYDTLLWDPSVPLPAGSAHVAFDVPAAAGSYRVLLFGHTADGRLGFYEGRLDVQPDLAR